MAGHILCNPAGNLTSAGSCPRSVCVSASSGEQPRRCPVRGDFRSDLTRADVGFSLRADRVREASTARLSASPAPPPQAASWQGLEWGWGAGVTPVPIRGSGGRGVKGPTGRKCIETANARSLFEQLWSQRLRRPAAGSGGGGEWERREPLGAQRAEPGAALWPSGPPEVAARPRGSWTEEPVRLQSLGSQRVGHD